MSSSQEWRFEIQTHHRDRKVTTSSATGNFLAHNFGFSGEFWLGMNDPEELSRNLLAEIENLSCQDCQIFRKNRNRPIGSQKRASPIFRFEAIERSLFGRPLQLTLVFWGVSESLLDVYERFWKDYSVFGAAIFFIVLQSSQNLRKSEKVVENRASPIFQFSEIERSRFWWHP